MYTETMEMKPQDVLVALRLALLPGGGRPAYATLASDLGMSASETHASIKRLRAARLVGDVDSQLRVNRLALLEFVIHGVKYAFPPDRGTLTRGMPTGYAAPPLNAVIVGGSDPPPVWPDAEGTARGLALSPLCRYAPAAAKKNDALYQVLALIDALRDGRARERQFAKKELEIRLGYPASERTTDAQPES